MLDPLTNILKNDKVWQWSSESAKAFWDFKQVIADELMLKVFNYEIPFKIHIDALALPLEYSCRMESGGM